VSAPWLPAYPALRAFRQGQAPAGDSGFPVSHTFRSFLWVVPGTLTLSAGTLSCLASSWNAPFEALPHNDRAGTHDSVGFFGSGSIGESPHLTDHSAYFRLTTFKMSALFGDFR
jgi:hypothetical protein